jgi:hypothetical protein
MSVKIDYSELDKLVKIKINNINEDIKRANRQALYKIGKDVYKTLRDESSARTKKSGRIYLVKLNGRLKRHQASAPGETPARLSGEYRKSINYHIQGSNELEFGVSVKYGGDLEYGTSKIKPRPGLANSVKQNLRNMELHIEREILNKLGLNK